ncbi:MAG: hypothetical protein H6833_10770 [Planctomycetes bacterium]|nr:hypothetical protein [Planctomycetota bacterium]
MNEPDLTSFLDKVLPHDFSYERAVQLHMRLFCTVDEVPPGLHSQCSRAGLSRAFAALAQAARLRDLPDGVEATTPGHWSWILDEMLSGRIELDSNNMEWLPGDAP